MPGVKLLISKKLREETKKIPGVYRGRQHPGIKNEGSVLVSLLAESVLDRETGEVELF